MLLVLLPTIILSLTLYLFLSLFGNQTLIWILSVVAGLGLSFVLIKKDWADLKKDFLLLFKLKNLPLFLIILIVLAATAYVLSPIVKTTSSNNFEHIVLTDVGDYYKHIMVVTSLADSGIPIKNPYFPIANLSYYYGYYLIPAFLSRVFGLYPNWSFYLWSLMGDFLGLLLITEVANKVLKKFYLKFLAITLVLFGTGVDIIPFVFNTLGQDQTNQGLQLINNYKALLFVPQHFFAACLTVFIIYKVWFDNLKLIYFVLISSFLFLCSVFVSLTFIFWSFLIFIFQKKLRLYLIKTGPLIVLLLLPYLLSLTDRGSLFFLNHFDPYPFTSNFYTNTFYTFFVKLGPMIILIPLLLVITRTFNLTIFLGIVLLLLSTLVIRTPVFNDYSMRTSMPIQLCIPIIFYYLISKIKSKSLSVFLIMCSLIILIISVKGFYLEYLRHWRNKEFLPPSQSEILLKIRSLPKDITLSSVDRNKWVELTPSLAFKKITNPSLFDSYMYLTGEETGKLHGQYESQTGTLFYDPSIASSPEELAKNKNQDLTLLHDFFQKYPEKEFLLNNKLWVKKDTNPWVIILSQMGVKSYAITSEFTAFNYQDLLEKTKNSQIFINTEKGQRSEVKNRQVFVPEGLSFITYCSEDLPKMVKIEFEDYYLVAEHQLSNPETKCLGKIFYLDKEDNLFLTNSSNIDHLFIFPIEIKK